MSEEFEIFLKENRFRHIRCAPYHSASNGEAERAVRTFKQAMKNMESETGTSETDSILIVVSHTMPHTTKKTTPGELLMNRKLRTRLDIEKPHMTYLI